MAELVPSISEVTRIVRSLYDEITHTSKHTSPAPHAALPRSPPELTERMVAISESLTRRSRTIFECIASLHDHASRPPPSMQASISTAVAESIQASVDSMRVLEQLALRAAAMEEEEEEEEGGGFEGRRILVLVAELMVTLLEMFRSAGAVMDSVRVGVSGEGGSGTGKDGGEVPSKARRMVLKFRDLILSRRAGAGAEGVAPSAEHDAHSGSRPDGGAADPHAELTVLNRRGKAMIKSMTRLLDVLTSVPGYEETMAARTRAMRGDDEPRASRSILAGDSAPPFKSDEKVHFNDASAPHAAKASREGVQNSAPLLPTASSTSKENGMMPQRVRKLRTFSYPADNRSSSWTLEIPPNDSTRSSLSARMRGQSLSRPSKNQDPFQSSGAAESQRRVSLPPPYEALAKHLEALDQIQSRTRSSLRTRSSTTLKEGLGSVRASTTGGDGSTWVSAVFPLQGGGAPVPLAGLVQATAPPAAAWATPTILSPRSSVNLLRYPSLPSTVRLDVDPVFPLAGPSITFPPPPTDPPPAPRHLHMAWASVRTEWEPSFTVASEKKRRSDAGESAWRRVLLRLDIKERTLGIFDEKRVGAAARGGVDPESVNIKPLEHYKLRNAAVEKAMTVARLYVFAVRLVSGVRLLVQMGSDVEAAEWMRLVRAGCEGFVTVIP
ncbi:hypothetical protein BDK51DRAFT_42140 [Blyttiomyces helicus]|uniref:PH domain-containing protein n=1 Tax=Blyttiomyces helicus TaxID=388810 RepID=A0A4P9WPT6_9FUNG|nr:hypothetical protein BDK51DRAFT_42140 [Blyttiomyces helicus]|eukprot:RKO93768.1 hypothetical protein BDK51DRAFT_42140 [Blyttiomyces helicus]